MKFILGFVFLSLMTTIVMAAEMSSGAKALGVGKYLLAHGVEILGMLSGIFAGLLSLALLIPGDQPDKFLLKAVGLINKVSNGSKKLEDLFKDKK